MRYSAVLLGKRVGIHVNAADAENVADVLKGSIDAHVVVADLGNVVWVTRFGGSPMQLWMQVLEAMRGAFGPNESG